MNARGEEEFLEVALRSVWFLYREAVTANAGHLADSIRNHRRDEIRESRAQIRYFDCPGF